MTLFCCFLTSSSRSLKCVLKNRTECGWEFICREYFYCYSSIPSLVWIWLFFPTENWIISILSNTVQIQHLQSRLLFLELERQLNYFTAGRDCTLRNWETLQVSSASSKGIVCWGGVALLPVLSPWEGEESLTCVVSLQEEEHHCCEGLLGSIGEQVWGECMNALALAYPCSI